MQAETKLSKRSEQRVVDALKALKNLQDANRIYRNQQVIANQPVPKHKQSYLDAAVTRANVKRFNAISAWNSIHRKLSNEEREQVELRGA